jgi:hypothetical protein
MDTHAASSQDYQLPIEYIREDAVVVNVASFKNVDEAALAEAKPNVRFVPMVGKVILTCEMLSTRQLLFTPVANTCCLR